MYSFLSFSSREKVFRENLPICHKIRFFLLYMIDYQVYKLVADNVGICH